MPGKLLAHIMNRAIALVILVVAVLVTFPTIARGAGTDTIPIESCSWSKTSLTVRIIPGTGVASYRSSFIEDVVNGIRNWNRAFSVWTDNFGSPYIQSLQFAVFIDGFNQTTATTELVTISFVSSLSTDGSVLGVTQLSSYVLTPTVCSKGDVQFSAQDISSDTVMTSVASHEFGHVLGLGHASNLLTADGNQELMYTGLADHSKVVFPSTLDVYALTQIFKWAGIPSGSFYRPSTSSFSLPQGIPYEQLTSYQTVVGNMQAEIQTLNAQLTQLQTEINNLNARLQTQSVPSPIGPLSWSSIIVVVLIALSSLFGLVSVKQHYQLKRLRQNPDLPQTLGAAPVSSSSSVVPLPAVASWAVCPKCGTYISADISTCVCGQKLGERQ